MTLRESLHERWANLQLWIRLLLAATLLAATGIFIARPAYSTLRDLRLKANLKAAQTAVKEQRMSEARDLSLTVLRSGNPGIDAYRILEESMAALRDPRHSDVARALLNHPAGSVEDHLAGFRGFAPDAPLGLLGRAWAALPEDSRHHPEFARIFADRLIAAKRLHEAAPVLLAIPEDKRTSAIHQRLAEVLILSRKREGFTEAQRMIARYWPGSESARAGWMDLLESIPAESLEPQLLKPVRNDLAHPGQAAIPRDALMLVRLDYADQPAGRQAILRQAVSNWKTRAPVELARFLNQLGLHSLLLETFSPVSFTTHPELLPVTIDSLVSTRSWQDLSRLLDTHGELLQEPQRLRFMALAAAMNGDSATRTEQWNAAMADADSSSGSTAHLALYQFALTHGMETEAEQALIGAILSGRGPLPLYSDIRPLLSSLAARQRENLLLQICETYLQFEPANPKLLAQYAYLVCLNDLSDPASILDVAASLANAFPNELPIQRVLATAQLAAGDPAAAADTLAPLRSDPATLPPGFRAVILTTRALNGTISPEDPAITSLPWQDMLPSERRKFSAWINQARTSSSSAPLAE